jgi:hypothetical protein
VSTAVVVIETGVAQAIRPNIVAVDGVAPGTGNGVEVQIPVRVTPSMSDPSAERATP